MKTFINTSLNRIFMQHNITLKFLIMFHENVHKYVRYARAYSCRVLRCGASADFGVVEEIGAGGNHGAGGLCPSLHPDGLHIYALLKLIEYPVFAKLVVLHN